MRHFACRTVISLFLIFSFMLFSGAPKQAAESSTAIAASAAREREALHTPAGNRAPFKRQPLRFEVNRGQTDAQAHFIARASDSTLFLASQEAVLRLPKLMAKPETRRAAHKTAFADISQPVESAVIRLRPVGGNPEPRLTGVDKLPGVSNYFIGNDPRQWRTSVEAYAKVKYENLYPGIDLIYYGNEAGEIEYDFTVAPGANPNLIAMSIEGADRVEVEDPSGDLILTTAVGRVRQHAPLIYQEIDGKRQEIAGRYRYIENGKTIQNPNLKIQNPLIAFALDDYDKSQALVIDPVVVYSTLLGGAAANFDGARDVAVDAQGNAYMVGTAESSDFPTRNALDGTPPPRFLSKAFISKFAPDGSLIYSTFLGSADGSSSADAIAVDATGAIYVAGTANPGFPIVNAFQPTPGSFSDAFLTKLNAEGTAIIHSSFLGGNQGENVRDLKLDAQNNVYILGEIPGRGAASVTFPTVNPTQANYGGGDRDMFLSVVAASGANLLFSTFFGGNGDEEAKSVSVSSDGNQIVIVGASDSTNLTTGGIAPQASDPSCDEYEELANLYARGHFSDPWDYIVFPFEEEKQLMRDRLGREPTCAELLDWLLDFVGSPGTSSPSLRDISVSPLANIPAGQIIGSAAYPPGGSGLVSPSSVLPQAAGGGYDVVVVPIDQNGNGSARGIFGGSRDEFATDSVRDSRGAVYITGDTNSTDLPTVAPTQAAPGGANENGFVVVFAPDTFDVLFATYLGGDGFTLPQSIAVDPQGNIFVSGIVTIGTTFPTTPGAFQRDLKGRNDAFLVKYSAVDIPTGPDFSLSFSPSTITTSYGKTKVTADINRTGGFTGNVTITPATEWPRGIILKGGSASTTGSRVTFKLKVKGNAAPGSHLLTFKARDDSGRERIATLTLILQ